MSANPLHILLIEDDSGDAEYLGEILADEGSQAFRLERVDRLAAGLERLAEGGIDLVLLDLGLPDSTGLETLTQICARAPAVPIVVLTGLTDETVGVAAIRTGAQEYLLKGEIESRLLVRALCYATERKQIEMALQESEERYRKLVEEIRKSNDELEERVIERTARLKAANDELESFAYAVSHDLRQPLRSMDGFSRALLQEYGKGLDDVGRHYLERIADGARRMGRLIDAILSLSRIGRSELKREVIDLAALARGIAAELRHQDPERQVELVVPEVLEARGDRDMVMALLQNLLENAWKFTAGRSAASISVGAATIDGEEPFFVRDNGAGFDMKYAGKLFTPFQRLHSPDDFTGLGVGLATAQRIVHRHGGRIWAEGEVERGAVFFFTLEPTEGRHT